MPDDEALSRFYESQYWDARGGNLLFLRAHDLIHVQMIQDLDPTFLGAQKMRVLNFGAGNGGDTFLFHLLGHDVINVEASGTSQHFDERWSGVRSIREVNGESIDLIYASHSLEHVPNIDDTLSEFSRVARKHARVFIEVPNALNPDNGAQKGKIDAPHTYYFSTSFFDAWIKSPLVNSGFSHHSGNSPIKDWDKSKKLDGEVSRVFGQLSNS